MRMAQAAGDDLVPALWARPGATTFDDWLRIDRAEIAAVRVRWVAGYSGAGLSRSQGRALGMPRLKMATTEEMLAFLGK